METKIKEAINFHKKGELDKAKEVCLEILKSDPKNFNILHLIGIIFFQKKNYKDSEEHIRKAIEINPNFADAHINHGIALKFLNKIVDSIKSWDKAIKINPKNFTAYNHKGVALVELRQHEEAIKCWNQAIKIKPDFVEAYNNIGNALNELKKFDEALVNYDQAIKIKPNFAEAYNNRASVLSSTNKLEDALASCENAIKIKPNFADAYNNKGIIQVKLKKLDDALNSYEDAIKLKPNFADAYNNRGILQRELKQLDAALESYEKAFKIKPDTNFLLGRLIATKNSLCKWDFFEENLKKLKSSIENGKKLSSPFNLLSIFDNSELQKKYTELFVKEEYPDVSLVDPITKNEYNKKIRLGYYSADFCNHPVSYLIANLFEKHDKSKFELFAFSLGQEKNDEMQKRISKAFDKFINVNSYTEKEIAILSRKLGIDIAIDLMGFTKNNKFRIFVNRCAPIQINYLGYAGTTGASCIDYIIADKILIPEKNQKNFSEKIIYLPNSFMVNDPTKKISEKTLKREDFGLPKKGFVFCCFNKKYKITPIVFNLWMNLLKKVDGSVLWLFEENIESAKNLHLEAKKRGIKEERIIFATHVPSLSIHFARHRLADLFLDTYPYTAHSTCSDALWAGLPVLTKVGESFASRVSGSLLNAIDIPELIVRTEDEYENKALELATNVKYINEIKNKIKMNRLTKPLFNIELFAKHIETAYKTIYERYNDNLPLENINIS